MRACNYKPSSINCLNPMNMTRMNLHDTGTCSILLFVCLLGFYFFWEDKVPPPIFHKSLGVFTISDFRFHATSSIAFGSGEIGVFTVIFSSLDHDLGARSVARWRIPSSGFRVRSTAGYVSSAGKASAAHTGRPPLNDVRRWGRCV